MPIKPFEFTTGDELIAQKEQQLTSMRASGDVQQQKMANNQVLIDALFGDPAIQKARAADKAISEGMALTQDEGEGNVDFQIRQQKAIMSGVAEANPQVAVQANQNILSLQQEKREQELLKAKTDRETAKEAAEEKRAQAGERRAEAGERRSEAKELRGLNKAARDQITFEENMAIAKSAKKTWIFETDPETGEQQPVKPLSDGLPDETAVSAFRAMQDENPEKGYKMVSGADFLASQGVIGGSDVGLTGKQKDKKLTALIDAGAVYREMGALFETVEKDLGALGLGAELIADLGAANVTAARFGRDFYEASGFEGEELEQYLKEDEGLIDRILKEGGYADQSATARAQMKGLAYKVAKILDPGGRLSDQDVEMAMQMVSGNGSASVIEDLMMERIKNTHKDFTVDLEMVRDGHVYGKYGQKQLDLYNEDLAEALALGTKLGDTIKANTKLREEAAAKETAEKARIDDIKKFGTETEGLTEDALEELEREEEALRSARRTSTPFL
jgi:hypothetical protein